MARPPRSDHCLLTNGFPFKSEMRKRIHLHQMNPERQPWRPLYNATADPYVCAHCGVEAFKMQRCSGCKTVAYCDRICQKRHWKQHKAFCDPDACLVFVGRRPLLYVTVIEAPASASSAAAATSSGAASFKVRNPQEETGKATDYRHIGQHS